MTIRTTLPKTTPISEVTANANSAALNVKDFRHIIIQVSTTNFSGALRVGGSINDSADYGAVSSLDNPYGLIQMKDLKDNSGKNGDIGVEFTSSTAVNIYEVNSNVLSNIGLIISSVTSGSITVDLVASGN